MNIYLIPIILVKVIFLILVIAHLYFKFKSKPDPKIQHYKHTSEFLFEIMMAILLIYLFNPRSHGIVEKEERILLFVFGIVLLLTAEWNVLLT